MKTFTTLIFLLGQVLLLAQANDAEWKLKKEVNDLQVFVRKNEDAAFKEIKVRYIANASMSNVVSVLRDVSAFPEWIYNCAEARVLERISDTETIYYSRIAFPFPMNDRDFIAHSKLWQNEDTKEIFIKVTGDYSYLPIKKDVVRLPKIVINWHIQPLSKGKIQVEYRLWSDPGGSIPVWLVNMAIDKGPVNSMQNFKKMILKNQYQNARLAYIQEMH